MRDWAAFVRHRLGPLAISPEREAEIAAELAQQLEQAYADAVSGGATEQEARRRAESHLGDWAQLAREIEAAERPAPPAPEYRAGAWHGVAQDVRYVLRFLRRNPAFAAIALATLAFGIGGNTAIFTMVDALVLRDMPYREPGRLMAIETRRTDQPEIEPWTSAADFFDFRERQRSFSTVAAISPVWNVVLTGRGAAEQLDALYVTAGFFPMLGVNAALGRTFSADEDLRGKPRDVVVLSHGFWQRRLGGRRDVLGQSLRLDNGLYTVIGVLPPDFRWVGEPVAGTATEIAVWLPMATNQLVNSMRSVRYTKVIGRVRPDVTLAQARDEVRRISAQLAGEYPGFDKGYASDARGLHEQASGKLRTGMLLLLGTVGFVLLMVCANLANLLLARAALRQREVTVRVAVGASSWRLIRQLLVEGLVLAVLGGAAGVPVAYLGLRALAAAGPESLFRPGEIGLDLRALAFTSAAVLLCAILAGLPPAWRVVRAQLAGALRESGRGLVSGHHRLRAALVVIQLAAALVLLVGAGLLVRSFRQVLAVPPGFDADNVVTIATQLPGGTRGPQARRAVYNAMRDRLLAQPGVASVAAVSRLPFTGKNLGTWVYVEGRDMPGSPGVEVEYRVATSTYFETMGIRLREGRLYDDRDEANPTAVVVINQAMARKLWPGEPAVGKRLKATAAANAPWTTVIGVVDDVRHFGLETDPHPELYRPYGVNPLGAPILVVRTRTDPASMLRGLSAAVRGVDPEIPTYNEYVMQDLVARSTMQRRFVMLLLAGFAVAAMLLAGLGIYGTISQTVAQRTPEIGVRMALGASPAEVLRMVLSEGARLMALGGAIGLAGAAALAWLMRAMLFEVAPLDPTAFAAAAIVLCGFALAACYVPARRASKVDPMAALRSDAG
jgi:predicted permease